MGLEIDVEYRIRKASTKGYCPLMLANTGLQEKVNLLQINIGDIFKIFQ